MAEKYYFFNSVNGDRVYQADHFAKYFKNFVTGTVFNYQKSDALQVKSNNNFTVTVKSGFGYIDGYLYENDSDLSLNVDIPDSVLHRKDAIVLKKDLTNRLMNIYVKKGTPASSPVVPTLQRDEFVYEVCLAEITVNAGQTNIATSHITDTRSDRTKCGYAQSTLYNPDFETYYDGVKVVDSFDKGDGDTPIPNAAYTKIPFDGSGNTRWNDTNDEYTVPQTGRYKITASVTFNNITNVGATIYLKVTINGTTDYFLNQKNAGSALESISSARVISLNAGDKLTLQTYVSTGTMSVRDSNWTHLIIEQL